MYKIAVLEDDTLYAEYLTNEISNCFSEQKVAIQTKLFSSAENLLSTSSQFDLYFLDILLPDGNGIDISAKIQNKYGKQFIVFVSNNNDSVFEAIHQSPLRFIRKEKLCHELPEACKAFLSKMPQPKVKKNILVKQNSIVISIPITSICYMETKGHYINFHCIDDTYHVRGNYKDYPELCESPEFGRSSQSFLIHLSFIKGISANELFLLNGEKLPISRSKKKEFQEKYMHYQRIKQYGTTI